MILGKQTKCRVCGNPDLIPVVDLGDQYVSSLFPTDLNYRSKISSYPLDLVMCQKRHGTCGVIQLGHSFDLTEMYSLYPYTSATNDSMVRILRTLASETFGYFRGDSWWP